ncbi:hypothetical protein QP027_01875 [Corynebacterium breve]|uniref:Uncharacterized protein n=1 Tax=Corynebacterium breve TaxID=3049799 RepID=A0ABY8VFR1_9CORY|nr:hypothetical protein [Corynebacterium breve]WIM68172.1 hypothetical protein QP027_01875 [Corynebacterium breve]
MTSYGDMRARITPIPTPPAVRLIGAALVGLSVAILTSDLGMGTRVTIALVAVVAVFLLVLRHPYRTKMNLFALSKNVSRMPTIGQAIPLMIWWLLLMLAPVVAPWPPIGVTVAWVALSALAWVVFPHVDGTRKLAFA